MVRIILIGHWPGDMQMSDVRSGMTGACEAKVRDLRLDFWRGLCIVDMALVHLLGQGLRAGEILTTLMFDYLRFAAGGFVFVSGLCVGAIHLPKALDSSRRRGVYLGCLRRAGFILAVHYLAELSFMLLCPLRGERVDGWQTLCDIALLRQGYDLLPFYVLMVALCPVFLELIRRGLWWVLAASSAAVFALGSRNPWALALPIQQHFFPLLWQLIFVAGLLAGTLMPRYDRLGRWGKIGVAAGAWTAMALLLFVARCERTGTALLPWLTFQKVPLSLGEAMRYLAMTLAVITTTDVLWRWIEPTAVRRFINALGRRSLGMAVLHIWIVGWIVKLSLMLPPVTLLVVLFMAAAVALLWLIARTLDVAARAWSRWYPSAPRMEYAAVPAAMALVVVALVAINPPAMPLLQEQVELADLTDPATLQDEIDDLIEPQQPDAGQPDSTDPAAEGAWLDRSGAPDIMAC